MISGELGRSLSLGVARSVMVRSAWRDRIDERAWQECQTERARDVDEEKARDVDGERVRDASDRRREKKRIK